MTASVTTSFATAAARSWPATPASPSSAKSLSTRAWPSAATRASRLCASTRICPWRRRIWRWRRRSCGSWKETGSSRCRAWNCERCVSHSVPSITPLLLLVLVGFGLPFVFRRLDDFDGLPALVFGKGIRIDEPFPPLIAKADRRFERLSNQYFAVFADVNLISRRHDDVVASFIDEEGHPVAELAFPILGIVEALRLKADDIGRFASLGLFDSLNQG